MSLRSIFSSRTSFGRRGLLVGALGLVAVGATGALSGCSTSDASQAAPAGLQEFTYLSYLPMETLSVAPELLADAGGYFEKHGLKVTFQTTKGSPQALQTLIAGVGPLTRVGAIDLITAAADDQPLVNVGTIVRGSSIRTLYSSSTPLKTPQDFVGKTIGVPSEGGTSDKSLSLMLENAGVDPKSVKRQVVGLGPGTFELVKRGDISGYMVSIDQSIVTMQQFPGDAAVFNAGDAVRADTQVYTATKDGLAKNGDQIKGYLAAIKEATQAIIDDKELDTVIATMRSKYSFASLNDDTVAKASLEESRQLWTAKGTKPLLTTDAGYWDEAYKELVGAEMAKSGGDPQKWMDNGFIGK